MQPNLSVNVFIHSAIVLWDIPESRTWRRKSKSVYCLSAVASAATVTQREENMNAYQFQSICTGGNATDCNSNSAR